MLVLTRKPGQRIMVGSNIALVVLEISGQRIRIGIDAPRHIPVTRAELTERVSVNCGDCHQNNGEIHHAVGHS